MLNQFSVQLLPGMVKLVEAHRLAGQQHDNLCGAYWGAIFLRSHGFDYTSEQVAQLAGTVLPIADSACIPNGAISHQEYGVTLPTTTQIEEAGTSVSGLMSAIEQLAQAYCLIPVQAEWTVEQVWRIIAVCENHPNWNLVPMCNLRTGHLWGSHLAISDAIAYLNGDSVSPSAADWNVGHFLLLAGTVKGKRALILACDTYPMFGWQGYHLQSPDAIVQALNRGDGYAGGILLFVAVQHKVAIEQELSAQNFTIAAWDNGSPAPQ